MRHLGPLFILAGLIGFVGCSGDKGEDTQTTRRGPQAPDPSEVQRSPDEPAEDGASDMQPFLRREAQPDSPPQTASRSTQRKEPFRTIRVFYGTNRAATGSKKPAEFFGRDAGPLSFGFCDVSIPPNHSKGKLESPKVWKFEFREDPRKHIVLMNVEPSSGPRFITELQKTVWESIEWHNTPDGPEIVGGDALVFVHGFNNTFEDAARRTAQIAHDLRFKGAPIMYSWPSQGVPTLRGYKDDGEMAGWSQEHLVAFMAGVAKESGARRIHLIAHSMGNRIVSETLRRLSTHFETGELPKFNEVILTAPDIDANYFKAAIAPRITQAAERITIYSSKHDIALKASSWVNRFGRRRLGEAGDELTTFPEYDNIDVIDASSVDTDLFTLRHSYHADSPTVLGDIEKVLYGLSTEQRGLRALLGSLAWQIHSAGSSLKGSLQGGAR